MSELDIAITYGLTEKSGLYIMPFVSSQLKADTDPRLRDLETIQIRFFEAAEDTQWRLGVLGAQAKIKRTPLQMRHQRDEIEKLDKIVEEARAEGKTPFRIAGNTKAVPKFIQYLTDVEVEFIV